MENIDASSFYCMPPCSGLVVTSFNKFEAEKKLKDVFPHEIAYNIYKKVTPYPQKYSNGKFSKCPNLLIIFIFKMYFRMAK